MKHRLPFLLAAILTAVTACGPTRYSTDFDPKTVVDYAFIEPYSHIIYYDERNNPRYDASLSKEAANLMRDLIDTEFPHFSRPIRMDYQGADASVARWLDSFTEMSASRASRLKVPKALVRKVRKTEYRYGIALYSYGHIQSEGARRLEQVERATVRAIERLSDEIADKNKKKRPYHPYIPSTQPYSNTIYYVIFDSKTSKIVDLGFDNNVFHSNPVDIYDVRNSLESLLKDVLQ